MPRRTVLDDARTELRNRPTSSRALARRAKRLAEFAMLVDRLTGTDLPTARDDAEGAMWNHALAHLRQRLGLPTTTPTMEPTK